MKDQVYPSHQHHPITLDRLLELLARDVDLLSGSLNGHIPRLRLQDEAEARAREARRIAQLLRGGAPRSGDNL